MAGAYCSRMFAIQGAHVRIVGDGALTSDQAIYLRSHTEVASVEDIDWAAVDVIIESNAGGPVQPQALPSTRAVRLELSPFGGSGPYAAWKSTDLVDYAVSGHAYLYGDPNREPIAGPPNQPAVAAGLFGFIGAMAALFGRSRHTRPAEPSASSVEVSHHEAMVALHQITLLRWTMTGNRLCRMGNRYTGQGQPNGPYRCRDGWISIVGVTDPQVEALLAVTGLTHLLDHPDITSPMDFQSYPELMDIPLRAWLAEQSVDETVELFQAMRIPACPLRSPAELVDDRQLLARGFFEPAGDGSGRFVPGPPFTRSHRQVAAGGAWVPTDDGRPLAGLRVLDLARVWAGPLCGRILADLGADVTWVEGPISRGPERVPDSFVEAAGYFASSDTGERPWNRNTHFVKYSLGKRSLAIDLQNSEGVTLFERLVPDAHVLLENFTPRVMPQLGLGEDRLHELNPDLIYLTMPGYGRSGPAENWLAYGSCIDSHAGLSSLIGYPDESPWKGGIAWPDPIAGLHACSAVLGSLWASAFNSAGGCTIEAAQFESTVAAIGDEVLAAQSGQAAADIAAAHPRVYRCAGDDTWIAVELDTPDHEQVVRGLAASDSEAANFADAPLPLVLASLAAASDAGTLARRLQGLGIAAAPVARAEDLLADPHLLDRSAFATVEQPDVGPFTTTRTPVRLDRQPLPSPEPAPMFGEHNRPILSTCGITHDEIARLESDGVLVEQPPR